MVNVKLFYSFVLISSIICLLKALIYVSSNIISVSFQSISLVPINHSNCMFLILLMVIFNFGMITNHPQTLPRGQCKPLTLRPRLQRKISSRRQAKPNYFSPHILCSLSQGTSTIFVIVKSLKLNKIFSYEALVNFVKYSAVIFSEV